MLPNVSVLPRLPSHVDVLIVGAGPIGLSLALSLQQTGLRVLLCEARASLALPADAAIGERSLALSYASRMQLEGLGVWPFIQQPSPIRAVEVSQQGSFGQTHLRADEVNLPDLGYVVRYADLHQALLQSLMQAQAASSDLLHIVCGVRVQKVQSAAGFSSASLTHTSLDACQTRLITAGLTVLAEGGGLANTLFAAQLQEKDYAQSALVAEIVVQSPQKGVAFERFAKDGPIALLPRGENAQGQFVYGVVATVASSELTGVLAQTPDELAQYLQRRFGERVGQFVALSALRSFPLSLKVLKQVWQPHVLCLGNAAQSLHPIAGQGLNLGLRDVQTLLALLQKTNLKELGSSTQLQRYASLRQQDIQQGVQLTDSLVQIFAPQFWLMQHGRSVALWALQHTPWLKRRLVKQMIFGR